MINIENINHSKEEEYRWTCSLEDLEKVRSHMLVKPEELTNVDIYYDTEFNLLKDFDVTCRIREQYDLKNRGKDPVHMGIITLGNNSIFIRDKYYHLRGEEDRGMILTDYLSDLLNKVITDLNGGEAETYNLQPKFIVKTKRQVQSIFGSNKGSFLVYSDECEVISGTSTARSFNCIEVEVFSDEGDTEALLEEIDACTSTANQCLKSKYDLITEN